MIIEIKRGSNLFEKINNFFFSKIIILVKTNYIVNNNTN